MEEKSNKILLPAETIQSRILLIRGRKVMLDSHLAELYGVATKRLNEAVRRNITRFPDDFMFQLTISEAELLRSQFATSKVHRGGLRYSPFVFTEQGVAMLSGVLNSERAVAVNIVIIRVFVRLREMLASHVMLLRRLDELEKEQKEHGLKIEAVFEAIRKMGLPEQAEDSKNPMGFRG
jgi:hypothetical protein